MSKNKLLNIAINSNSNQSDHTNITYKSKQIKELQRLRSICFPQKSQNTSIIIDNNKINQSFKLDRTLGNIPTKDIDTSLGVKHKKSNSFYFDKCQNRSQSQKHDNSNNNTSYLNNQTHHDISFNMSPHQESSLLSSEDSIDEFDKDIKFDKIEKDHSLKKYASESPLPNNSFMNLSVIDTKDKTPEKSTKELYWDHKQIYYMKDCKANFAKENFWQCVDHLTYEMKSFTNNLMGNMKDICLTKMSEKTVNLMMKKYTLRLDTLKDQWKDQENTGQNVDFNVNLKNMLNILGNW